MKYRSVYLLMLAEFTLSGTLHAAVEEQRRKVFKIYEREHQPIVSWRDNFEECQELIQELDWQFLTLRDEIQDKLFWTKPQKIELEGRKVSVVASHGRQVGVVVQEKTTEGMSWKALSCQIPSQLEVVDGGIRVSYPEAMRLDTSTTRRYERSIFHGIRWDKNEYATRFDQTSMVWKLEASRLGAQSLDLPKGISLVHQPLFSGEPCGVEEIELSIPGGPSQSFYQEKSACENDVSFLQSDVHEEVGADLFNRYNLLKLSLSRTGERGPCLDDPLCPIPTKPIRTMMEKVVEDRSVPLLVKVKWRGQDEVPVTSYFKLSPFEEGIKLLATESPESNAPDVRIPKVRYAEVKKFDPNDDIQPSTCETLEQYAGKILALLDYPQGELVSRSSSLIEHPAGMKPSKVLVLRASDLVTPACYLPYVWTRTELLREEGK